MDSASSGVCYFVVLMLGTILVTHFVGCNIAATLPSDAAAQSVLNSDPPVLALPDTDVSLSAPSATTPSAPPASAKEHSGDSPAYKIDEYIHHLDGPVYGEPVVPVDCLIDEHCADGSFCNGEEFCLRGLCQPGSPPCLHTYCDEVEQSCVECVTNRQCDDGLYCNGAEFCEDGQCGVGPRPCPSQVCIEAGATCGEMLCDGGLAPYHAGQVVGFVPGALINEASGLVVSRRNSGIMWTHNDNPGDNRIFALDMQGNLRGIFTMGTGAYDPEDIAIGPGPIEGADYLYLGDIGDNNDTRSHIFVKRVVEPTIGHDDPVTVAVLDDVALIKLRYPAGPDAPAHKDAETLLVDPENGDILIITKRTSVGCVYRAPYPHSTTAMSIMSYVGTTPWKWTTGGDVSPDGRFVVIRRYSDMQPQGAVWYRPPGTFLWEAFTGEFCKISLELEPQGEAIAWDAEGMGFLTLSEDETPGVMIPIWHYALRAE